MGSKETVRAYMQRLRETRKALGRCTMCGKAAPDNYVTCPACRKRVGDRQRERRQERIRAGKCPMCGKPVEGKYMTCPDCLAQAREYYKEHK